MIEKVNPSHPDKIADRIAGAIIDLAYSKVENPKIAVEVLIGHGNCHIILESSIDIMPGQIRDAVYRIVGTDDIAINIDENPQDIHLAENQAERTRCGDNGIFKGVPINDEEKTLSNIVRSLYGKIASDGKFIYDEPTRKFIACQSNATSKQITEFIQERIDLEPIVNPLGEWTGGVNVDTGATNRKLGSDMGRAVTGGGLHGKDLSKADVSVNIACHLLAQRHDVEVDALCAIGDDEIVFKLKGKPKIMMSYDDVVKMASDYIKRLGGFEKLAEWGLV